MISTCKSVSGENFEGAVKRRGCMSIKRNWIINPIENRVKIYGNESKNIHGVSPYTSKEFYCTSKRI